MIDVQPHTAGLVAGPGLYDMPAAVYHADCAPEPSLSSSIARTLLAQSPLHAYHRHPRLGGATDDAPDRQREIGTAAHKLLLGRGAEIVVVDADSYHSKDAKEQRGAAYAENCAPILRPDLDTVEAMVAAARRQLRAFPELRPLIDGEGQSEVALVWRDCGIWARGLVDWLHPDGLIRADYKTTSASAHPGAVSSRLYGSDAPLQDRFYHWGFRALGRPTKRSLFIVQECEPPFALSVAELDDRAQEYGDQKVTRAIETWRDCLSADEWPGYVPRVAVAECPAWYASAWDNLELAVSALREAERPRGEMLLEIAS